MTEPLGTSPQTPRPVGEDALNTLFLEARTFNAWLDRAVPESLLRQVYELARMGPTSANLAPARFVFVVTAEARERLLPAMAAGNVEQTRTAPVTVIVAYDTQFYEQAPKLWPHSDMRGYFLGKPELAPENALRNGSLQGAYLILAARALGLDCGPMSGFDAGKVNAEFFPDGKWKSNFVCNLGYGDRGKLRPRGPRLEFEEACQVV